MPKEISQSTHLPLQNCHTLALVQHIIQKELFHALDILLKFGDRTTYGDTINRTCVTSYVQSTSYLELLDFHEQNQRFE